GAAVGPAAAAEERRVDHRGHDHADPDAVAVKFVAEALREGGQARLGRRVDRLAADAGDPGDRGYEDHPAPAALDHAPHEQGGQFDGRGEVDRGQFGDLRRRDLANRPGPAQARVVNEDVDAAAGRGERLPRQVRRAARGGQVTGERNASGPAGYL